MSTTTKEAVSPHLSDEQVIEIYIRCVRAIDRWKDWTEPYFKGMVTLVATIVIIIAGIESYASLADSGRLTNLNDTMVWVFCGSLFLVGILGLYLIHFHVPKVVQRAADELGDASIVGTVGRRFSEVGRDELRELCISLQSGELRRYVVAPLDIPEPNEFSYRLRERFGFDFFSRMKISFPMLPKIAIWITTTPPGQEERTVVFTFYLQVSSTWRSPPDKLDCFSSIESWFLAEVERLIRLTNFWSQIEAGGVPKDRRHHLLLNQLQRASDGNPITCWVYTLVKIEASLELTTD